MERKKEGWGGWQGRGRRAGRGVGDSNLHTTNKKSDITTAHKHLTKGQKKKGIKGESGGGHVYK